MCELRPPDFLLIILAAIGVVIMVGVGNTVVKEYNIAKHYEPTTCSYLTRTSLGFRTCNSCDNSEVRPKRSSRRRSGRSCHTSSFPCVQILVKCHDNLAYNSTAIYYPDAFHSVKSTMCSYYVCNYGAVQNEIAVQQFVDKFTGEKMRHQFVCYRDRNRPSHVIGRKIFTYTAALHGMLWPTLLVAISLGTLAIRLLCKQYRSSRRNEYTTARPVIQDEDSSLTTDVNPGGLTVDNNSGQEKASVGGNVPSSSHPQYPMPMPYPPNDPPVYHTNMTGYLPPASLPGPGYQAPPLLSGPAVTSHYPHTTSSFGGNMAYQQAPNNAPPPDYRSIMTGTTPTVPSSYNTLN